MATTDAPSQVPTVPRAMSRTDSATAMNREGFKCKVPKNLTLNIVVFGASGDLAKKKTYPALFELHRKGFLPNTVQIVGYARSSMKAEELRKRLREHLKGDAKHIDSFLNLCSYIEGKYEPDSEGFKNLYAVMTEWESQPDAPTGRLFYLALPPYVYPDVCAGLSKQCSDLGDNAHERSWVRVIVEKPFGKDLESSEELANQLGELFTEQQLYRIDHYLGKELTQNLLVMRYANPVFSSWWNRNYINNIQITMKEDFGTQGRGGYFDSYGIIRDVIQNHLMQVLSLVMMEQPVSSHPDDIRDEKTKLLRCIRPVTQDDCVLGQYVAGNGEPGYLDDEGVPKDSKVPTFAACKLMVNNERWAGVPVIIKAGKALNEKVVVVRIQLRSSAAPLFGVNGDEMRNEFVMRLQPGEAVYVKMVVKKPGLEMETEMSELDLSYKERYQGVNIPDAYERLILDCIRGDAQHFVRRDELRAAWAIFTPLLHEIDAGKADPEPYPYGSRGPASQDKLLADAGYIRSTKYVWRPHTLAEDGSK